MAKYKNTFKNQLLSRTGFCVKKPNFYKHPAYRYTNLKTLICNTIKWYCYLS